MGSTVRNGGMSMSKQVDLGSPRTSTPSSFWPIRGGKAIYKAELNQPKGWTWLEWKPALFKRTDQAAPAADHDVWVYVDDLDAHFAHAQSNGAKILSDIDQHGYRSYKAEDLEGHHWTFTQARPAM